MKKKLAIIVAGMLILSMSGCDQNIMIAQSDNDSQSDTGMSAGENAAGSIDNDHLVNINDVANNNQTSILSGDSVSDTQEAKDSKYEVVESTIDFSELGGIYSDEFELQLSADSEYAIYYTLDGSNPLYSGTAMEYTAPIQITNREGDANVVSAVDPNLFCSSYSEYHKDSGLQCTIKAPSDRAVDKCTTVRAVAIKDNQVTEVSSQTYFVGDVKSHIQGIEESCEAAKKDLANGKLAIISITMDYDDLFDPSFGMYVKGNIFDAALSNEIATNNRFNAEDARKLPANYNQRGKEWERIAHMEMFEADGSSMESVLNQDCGVRIQGNYSRSDLQKSFRLYARKDYGNKSFEYPIWGSEASDSDGNMIDSYKTMVLRAGGNCAFTAKFNDTYWQDLASNVDCDTKASRPCVVYLNGEYWGLYVLEEDYSSEYFESHYGVNKDNVVVYKGDAETYECGYKLDEGKVPEGESDDYYFRELNEFFATHSDLKNDADYEAFAELVDVESVMDYFAVEVWINNKWDWPGKNWSMWKVVTSEEELDAPNTIDNEYADGKWRFSLYDVEFGGVSGESDAYTNTVKEDNYKPKGLLDMGTTNPAVLCFAYLMTNDDFNEAYCQRLTNLSKTNFMRERAYSVLDQYEKIYGPLYPQFFARYPESGKPEDAINGGYASSKCIRDFLKKRADNIEECVKYCKSN